ncbi:ATP-binding protein [Candidatus Shapirobacteria bacterium]|nr:ATP-binding protein [Candidatus Shapirobacteria bacterium]
MPLLKDSETSLGTGAEFPLEEPYRAEAFVGRRGILQLIEKKVECAKRGAAIRPLVELYGVAGTGKTWLTREIARLFRPGQQRGTAVIMVDLQATPILEDVAQGLITSLEGQVPPLEPKPRAQTPGKMIASALAEMRERDAFTPIIIFDHTEAVARTLLDLIEEDIIFPNIMGNDTIFIAAGQSREGWKKFEVRRRVEPTPVPRFSAEEMADLADREGLGPETLRAIGNYSFGHPLTTAALVRALKSQAGHDGQPLTPDHVVTQEQATVLPVLGRIVNEVFFKRVASEEVKHFLILASCLRKLNANPLRTLATQENKEYAEKPGTFYLDMVSNMVNTYLCEWRKQLGGYGLDYQAGRILDKREELDPATREKWAQRHQRATAIWADFTERYPRNSAGFLLEQAYHLGRLGRRNEVAAAISAQIQKLSGNPAIQWDFPEVAAILKERFAEDEELQQVLGETVYGELGIIIDQFSEQYPISEPS